MKKSWGAVALTGALAVTLAGCSAGTDTTLTAEPSRQPAPAAPTDSSDAALAQLVDAAAPGCSAAVAVNGQIAWAGARGLARLEPNTPIDVDTLFDIASVSKQFTATAILLLVQDGTVSLDDAVGNWVAGLPPTAAQATVADLMHHQSGIPDYTTLLADLQGSATTQDDALEAIRNATDFAEPGSFAYSNSNYVLLAEVVAAASGTALPSFLEANVFSTLDLDMRLEPGLADPRVATGYSMGEPATLDWSQLGDGSVYATPTALALWGDVYRTGSLAGEELLSMQTEGGAELLTGSRYAAGVEVAPDGAISHVGGWAGFTTLFGVTADRSTVIAVSCNAYEAPAVELAVALQTIWDR